MRSGNKLLVCLLAIFSFSANAASDSFMGNGLKELIVAAIKDGKSSGYMDESMTAIFAVQTKSKEPIKIDIERLRQFDDRCAELGVVTHQAGVRDANGKPGFYRMQFKLPICIDGSYPEFLRKEDEERKKAELKKCRQTVVKGSSKDGFMGGAIEFKGCPANGIVGIFYDGQCQKLGPGPNALVKEFNFNQQGDLSIQMAIPQACVGAKPTVNKWQLYIFEKQNATAPKQLVGIKQVYW